MSHFSIAGMQLELKNQNNMPFILDQIRSTKARFPWLDMIVLTELCGLGVKQQYAQTMPSEVEQALCLLAAELNLWIISGSQYESSEEAIYNTGSVINTSGEVVERFRKLFPFEPYEKGITGGDRIVTVEVPGGKIGVAICYDLWFPEVSRGMVLDGAEVLIFPTLTGTTDRKLELVLSQATAIANQAYVFSINAAGELGNGQSIIVGPEGNILYQAGQSQEIIPIEVDFNHVRRTRENGILKLGQPLKSLRQHSAKVIPNLNYQSDYLTQLGQLTLPGNDD